MTSIRQLAIKYCLNFHIHSIEHMKEGNNIIFKFVVLKDIFYLNYEI